MARAIAAVLTHARFEYVSLTKKRGAHPMAPLCLPDFSNLLPSAPARGEEYCRRREELCVRKLGSHTEAIEPAFSCPTTVATVECQEILVVEMPLDFVKVWLEIDGFAETKVIRLGAGFFRKPRQVRLGIESAKRTAAPPRIAGVDRPDIDVFFLGAFNGRIQVRIRDTGASAKIVNARGKEEDRFAFPGLGPALHPVLEGEVRARECPATAQRQAQSLCGERMILGEILRHHSRSVACVRDGNVSGGRLSHKKHSQIIPLVSDAASQRIVDQHRQEERFAASPARHLLAFLALIRLHIVFLNCTRGSIFLARCGHCNGDGAWLRRSALGRHGGQSGCSQSGQQQSPLEMHFPVHLKLLLLKQSSLRPTVEETLRSPKSCRRSGRCGL